MIDDKLAFNRGTILLDRAQASLRARFAAVTLQERANACAQKNYGIDFKLQTC